MSSELAGRTALVTGASQGIGRAITMALRDTGVRVVMVGRSLSKLQEVAADIGNDSAELVCMQADLGDKDAINDLAARIINQERDLDILINCGGMYARGAWSDAPAEVLEALLRTNVVGPYTLTRALLPRVTENQGDIVFVNSSIVRHSACHAGQFAATQHAIVGLANALRAEVGSLGVRVMSVYPGRTATPRQQHIFDLEGRAYSPDKLLQPADIANAIVSSLALGGTAEVTDLHIRQRHKS